MAAKPRRYEKKIALYLRTWDARQTRMSVLTPSNEMSKAKKLRELLGRPQATLLAGAHNGLTAKLVEEAGFDGVWGGGFENKPPRAPPRAPPPFFFRYR